MKQSISLITLNIERDKHFSKFIPFVNEIKPDVLCLQEVCEKDLIFLEKELGMKSFFSRMTIFKDAGCIGVAVFTNLEVVDKSELLYSGDIDKIKVFEDNNNDTVRRVLLYLRVKKGECFFDIGNTHFTWTNDGEADERQRIDLESLLFVLTNFESIVFVGDFNAPRGKEIFSKLNEKYTDNIPKEIKTSIDKDLHRAGDLGYMVDGIFSTSKYEVSNVRQKFGVSDHGAFLALIKTVE